MTWNIWDILWQCIVKNGLHSIFNLLVQHSNSSCIICKSFHNLPPFTCTIFYSNMCIWLPLSLTILYPIVSRHVRGHLSTTEDAVTDDGELCVGEGHLTDLRPRPVKQVSSPPPCLQNTGRHPWGVVLLKYIFTVYIPVPVICAYCDKINIYNVIVYTMDTGNKDQFQMDPQKHRNVCNYVLILVCTFCVCKCNKSLFPFYKTKFDLNVLTIFVWSYLLLE